MGWRAQEHTSAMELHCCLDAFHDRADCAEEIAAERDTQRQRAHFAGGECDDANRKVFRLKHALQDSEARMGKMRQVFVNIKKSEKSDRSMTSFFCNDGLAAYNGKVLFDWDKVPDSEVK